MLCGQNVSHDMCVERWDDEYVEQCGPKSGENSLSAVFMSRMTKNLLYLIYLFCFNQWLKLDLKPSAWIRLIN